MDKRSELLKQILDMGVSPEEFTNAYDKEQTKRAEQQKKKKELESRRNALTKALRNYLSELSPEDECEEVIKTFDKDLKDVEDIVAGGHTKIHFKLNNGKEVEEFYKEGSNKEVSDAFDEWFDQWMKKVLKKTERQRG